MKKSWIAPTEIHVAEVLNNRALNQNYIADITESMTDKGFLPEFPIDVFLTENLANVDTELPYVCACGAHRTIAATNAKLEKVLVHIHDGREEAFIETMHLDNFQFDPAQNTGIGQPFTNKEKRAAVTQLLLLPKFFEQTNAALNELWNIPEANIRRWRGEVVVLLETDSPNLRLWSVSDGRLARLRELAASTERKDAKGEIVKIRQKYVDASDDEKEAFWDVIENDMIEMDTPEIIGIDDVRGYLSRHFGVKSRWYPCQEVTMRQLQQVHQLILDADADFIGECLDAARAEKEIEAQKNAFQEAVDRCEAAFKKAYAPQEGEWSDVFRDMRKRFRNFVRSQDEKYAEFEMKYYDYDRDGLRDNTDAEAIQRETALHQGIIAAIETEADWLQGFMDAEEETLKEHRKSVEADWRKHRKALIAAVSAYPRAVGESSLVYKGDAYLRQDAGTLEKLLATDAPSAKKFTATIQSEAGYFKQIATAIETDAPWVKEIPVPKPLIDVLVDPEDFKESPLSDLSLDAIFLHIQSRVDNTTSHSGEDLLYMKGEILRILGEASRGILETQIWLIADIGLWLATIRDGEDIPK